MHFNKQAVKAEIGFVEAKKNRLSGLKVQF